jgi:hypothetical protein
MDPAKSVCDWDNKWNQTENLGLAPHGENYYTITEWGPDTGYGKPPAPSLGSWSAK